MATQSVPDEIIAANTVQEADSDGESTLNLGFVAIMVAAIIIVVLVMVALLVLRGDR